MKMTKQEAIEAIERFRLLAHGHAVLAEALDMAIEALTELDSNSTEVDKENDELSCSEKPNDSDIINEILNYLDNTLHPIVSPDNWHVYARLHDMVTSLSAQPEHLTDKEQQIFLAAMEREREVCKQVDEEWRNCREPYEDSLVMICNEIVRKVEGALWMI